MNPSFSSDPYREDEQAPADYTLYRSVNEGREREAASNPFAGSGPRIRRRVEPRRSGELIDDYRANVSSSFIPDDVGLENADQSDKIERVVYPDTPSSDFVSSQSHFQTDEAGSFPKRTATVSSPPAAYTAADGSRYAAPQSIEMPDWLKTSMHNHADQELANHPRVRAAKAAGGAESSSRDFQQAGYPTELISEQIRYEQQQSNTYAAHRNPGARRVSAAQSIPVSHTAVPTWQEEARKANPQPHGSQNPGNPYLPAAQGIPVSHTAVPTWQEEARKANPQPHSSQNPSNPYLARTETAHERKPATAPTWQEEARKTNPQPLSSQNPNNPYLVRSEPARERKPSPPYVPAGNPSRQSAAPKKKAGRALGGWFLALCFLFAMAGVAFAGVMLGNRAKLENEAKQHQNQLIAQAQTLRENHPIRYRELIETKADKYGLQPAFVASIILNESSYDPSATSSVGARGLMQCMDATSQWIWSKLKLEGSYSFDLLYDETTNVEFGCWYLNYLSQLFHGDPILVAAAFHAGQGEVSNWLSNSSYSSDGVSIPLDKLPDGPTKTYVRKVLKAYAVYKDLYRE